MSGQVAWVLWWSQSLPDPGRRLPCLVILSPPPPRPFVRRIVDGRIALEVSGRGAVGGVEAGPLKSVSRMALLFAKMGLVDWHLESCVSGEWL